MFFISIIFLTTILVPLIQSGKPSLKLTFTPDEKFYAAGHQVEILCELLNPTDSGEPAQLWHVDLKTGMHTQVSRKLILQPTNDGPETFRKNPHKHVDYLKRNHIRIRNLQLEDSARYECSCPDCDPPIEDQKKVLQVMKLSTPVWHIEPGWPIQEHARTTIKCTADDFYPYVSYKIIRNHHEITHEGKSSAPSGNAFPQKFSWEATVTPSADWHNTTLRCTVTQGNTEQHAVRNLEVLFTPRFLKCDEKQYVNSTKENASVECSYAGNPQPTLTWYRQTDEKPLKTESGVNIETKDEHHNKYRSIVTFDREKLIAVPMTTTTSTTTTKSANGKPDTTKLKVASDNYYQHLLNEGFIVKLTINNEEKGVQKINVVTDVNDVRAHSIDSSSTQTIRNLSTIIILLLLLTFL